MSQQVVCIPRALLSCLWEDLTLKAATCHRAKISAHLPKSEEPSVVTANSEITFLPSPFRALVKHSQLYFISTFFPPVLLVFCHPHALPLLT